jgi:predicted NUDIX family phosphoesterase
MSNEEQVLVVERKIIEQVGMFNGLMFNVDEYFREIFARKAPSFMKRSQAEKNPDFKQLIPYVIMSHQG